MTKPGSSGRGRPRAFYEFSWVCNVGIHMYEESPFFYLVVLLASSVIPLASEILIANICTVLYG